MNKFKLPTYVSLNGTEMKLRTVDKEYRGTEKEYHRAAGEWSVGYVVLDGKVFSVYINEYSPKEWLNNVELKPIALKEWREGNKGYV